MQVLALIAYLPHIYTIWAVQYSRRKRKNDGTKIQERDNK